MAVPDRTLSAWEREQEPAVTSYPLIIAFLGCEPWPEPKALPERLLAARRRRGLPIEAAAQLLRVEPSTWWWWEAGRKPHRIEDRARIAEFIASPTSLLGPSNELPGEPSVREAFDLGAALRQRRKELGMTQRAAATALGANQFTLMNWELNRHAPADRFYPPLIRFLGRDPWPEPETIGERVRAERMRRGLTCQQFAAVLQVDEGSVAMWERGDGPHRSMAKAKVEAFLAGDARPWGRRKTRRKSSGTHYLAATP
jgi:transcriptional regulator with XRE-family HTH domain